MSAANLATHPCLLSYGNTHETNLPLILVVGREPNGAGAVDACWGKYDFRDFPSCGLWNVAYGVMGTASTPSVDSKTFKSLVESKGVSPLIIADAMPQSIEDRVRNKDALRTAHSDAAIKEHIANIFSHERFMSRVRCVLLSGLGTSFRLSVREYEEQLGDRGIPFQHLPFFTPMNVPKIRAAISPDIWRILGSAASELAAYPLKAAA